MFCQQFVVAIISSAVVVGTNLFMLLIGSNLRMLKVRKRSRLLESITRNRHITWKVEIPSKGWFVEAA
eukprot:10262931-Karenia_brevis.AAC.1